MTADKQTMHQWLVGLRREFHRYPELSGQEIRTTKKICQVLESLKIAVQTFEDMTGAVGLLTGKHQDPETARTIALRADIDALPMTELCGHDYQSLHEGVMHACGHDANIAIVLGVAKKIVTSGLLQEINGSVKLVFQPAEERLGGAKAMIERGVLDNPPVHRIIAAHMDPNLSVGTVGVFKRVGHAASDPFELKILGKGAHGARPHKGINPITAGGMFVTGLESIVSRHVKPSESAVISVGTFHAGDAGNVIPDTAVLSGSMRSHDEDVRGRLFKEMKRLAQGIETMMGVQCELTFKPGAPLGRNDETVCNALRRVSVAVLGEEKVNILPFIMGSDDFYFFARQCPAAMMRLGCASSGAGDAAPLHSPYFDIHEDVLDIGVDILFGAVKDFFQDRV